MRPGPAAIAGLLLALAPILPGCGDEQTTAAGSEAGASEPAPAVAAKARAGKRRPSVPIGARRCRAALGEFLDATESLNNTVAVGLDYEGYLTAVNRVRATYAAVSTERLSIVCLARAASPAEHALNLYIEAANTWGDCLAAASCTPGEVEPALQRRWAEAADLIASAQDALRG